MRPRARVGRRPERRAERALHETATQRREQHTERLKALAEERGGRLLSASYVDATTPLRWECSFGHSWEAQAEVATRCWCAECMRRGVYDMAIASRK